MNFKKLQLVSFVTAALLLLTTQTALSHESELVESCGVASTGEAARSAAWRNAECPEGYVKDNDPDFLCNTLTESLDREIEGQNCTLRRGTTLRLCTVRCFKDGLVENVLRAVFPPNSPNDIGNGRRSNGQNCVNIGGTLSCN